MRIQANYTTNKPIPNINFIDNKKHLNVQTTESNIHFSKEKNNAFNISFGKIQILQISPAKYKNRVKDLETKGIEKAFAKNIASLPDDKYERANELFSKGVSPEFVEDIIALKEQNYKQALKLWDKGIFDASICSIATLDGNDFDRALTLLAEGIDSDCISLFIQLSTQEYQRTIELMNQGYPPIIAANYSKLTEEEIKTAEELLSYDADIEIAVRVSKYDKDRKEKCLNYAREGIDPEFISELSNLTEDENIRLAELKALRIGDSNLADLAKLNKKDYQKALELIKKGVYEDYIIFILEKEKKNNDKEYKTYRNKGYSQTSALAISLLQDEEIEALEQVIKKNPKIKNLFKDEYDVSIIDVQNDNGYEAILTKEMRTENGTKITLVRTYNEYGEETKSRTEKYKDNSTSSIMSNKSNVFKTQYDKNGEIKELIEYVHNIDTQEIIGVIHSKKSDLLPGVFESVYYNISDFKTTSNDDINAIDTNIKDAVITNGEPISTVVKNADGSVTYNEEFQINEMISSRNYTEKRNENGEITYTSYEYKIQEEGADAPSMDISREFKRNEDGSIDNTINGIKYHIEYDDDKKVITISDGEKQRRLFTKGRLAKHSQETLWKEIKNLQVDTVLDIFNRIKRWNYCIDADSYTNNYERMLSTGKNNSIILHEVGHLLANEQPSILENDDFIQSYGTEMQNFQENVPYNEQLYLQYFSPRANLFGSDGDDEFIAETNILLTTYGTNTDRIKTRTQFLEKYFPKTISLVANLTGKNSRKSLLK